MIAVDCEMSGLEPRIHSILSIGAVDINNPERRFYGECGLPQNKTFDPVSLTICGFSEDEIKDKNKKSLKDLMNEFYTWVKESSDDMLVGQNITLDRDFLNTAFAESEIDFKFHYRCVDLHSAAISIFLLKGRDINKDEETGRYKMSLDRIAEALGMPQEPRPHNALTGALYNTEVFSRLVYGKNAIEDFKDSPIV